MEFNSDPNKQATELLFSCKKNSPNHLSLFFNGTVVPTVNERKHFGLTLENDLNVSVHFSWHDSSLQEKKSNFLDYHIRFNIFFKIIDIMRDNRGPRTDP